MSEKIEDFSIVVRRFCEWAESEYPANSQSLKQALELITGLFWRGIQLVDEVKEIEEDSPSVESANGKADRVYSQACDLPLTHYSEVFDPNVFPPDEPVIGHLADDISDIYQDLQCGLSLLDAGHPDHAVWEWVFSMQKHWGAHATSAIRALYWYLQENETFE